MLVWLIKKNNVFELQQYTDLRKAPSFILFVYFSCILARCITLALKSDPRQDNASEP